MKTGLSRLTLGSGRIRAGLSITGHAAHSARRIVPTPPVGTPGAPRRRSRQTSGPAYGPGPRVTNPVEGGPYARDGPAGQEEFLPGAFGPPPSPRRPAFSGPR